MNPAPPDYTSTSACTSLGMGLPAVTSILFGQIISPPLCVFDFVIQVRQFGYVTARNRLSWNVCLAPLIRFHESVDRESMPPA